MIVVIRLIGEEDDRLKSVELDTQISFGDLKKHIETLTHIPPPYQHLEWRGKLIASQHPIQSIKGGEEIVVAMEVQRESIGFLVNGFPRNYNNLEGWEKAMSNKVFVHFVLYLSAPLNICSMDVLTDLKESIEKRIVTYNNQTLPVIQYYALLNMVKEIDGTREPKHKHSLLDNWSAFKAIFYEAQKVQKSKNEHKINNLVDRALDHLKPLNQSAFFIVYAVFESTFLQFYNEFSDYVDYDNKYIEYAAQDYFSKLFNDNPEHPIVKIKCEPKEKIGAQGGLICKVMKSGTQVGTYHVKIHLGISTHSSAHQNADLRELFVYRLLELIKVGPKVHFLPNVHYSKFALYIATEDVMGFRRANDTTMNDVQMSQLDLLRHILFLTDLHSANYGVDGNGNLSIVDFQLANHRKSAKAQEYLIWDKEMRIQIGKDCFESWKFPNIVNDADNAITHQKNFLREKCIDTESSKAYEKYLSQIKNNIASFAICFK